jgi:hypothetical protein
LKKKNKKRVCVCCYVKERARESEEKEGVENITVINNMYW